MSKSRRLAYLALLYNALIWGAAFPIIKPVFEFLTPLQYLFFRFLTAGLFALPIFLTYYLRNHPKPAYLLKVWLLELAGLALPILILYEGLARTSALEASLIGATGPIFVVLGGIWFLHERESKREWQGLALSLLGSLILVIAPVFTQGLDTPVSTIGNLYILGYNIVWAVYAIIAKKFYKTKPPLALGSLTYLGTALLYGLVLSSQHALPSFGFLISNFNVLFPILYMAIPGGIIANIFYLYAASRIEVSEANLFTYLNGIVAIPAAYLLLGERPSLTTLLAVAVITYGVFRAETRSK